MNRMGNWRALASLCSTGPLNCSCIAPFATSRRYDIIQ